jgi:hypothetical protein
VNIKQVSKEQAITILSFFLSQGDAERLLSFDIEAATHGGTPTPWATKGNCDLHVIRLNEEVVFLLSDYSDGRFVSNEIDLSELRMKQDALMEQINAEIDESGNLALLQASPWEQLSKDPNNKETRLGM